MLLTIDVIQVYVNSLLAVLNSRALLRPKTDELGAVEMSTDIQVRVSPTYTWR